MAAVLAALFTAFLASAAPAAPVRFQIEGTGVYALLSGSESLADQHDRRDLYPPALGFAFTASLGVTDHLVLGVRSGLLRERKDDIDPAIALARWKALPGYSSFRAAQATHIERTLSTIPTHAIVQWRGRLPGKFGFYDELGVGVASFSDKIEYVGANGTLLRLAAYQKNLSFLVGGGLSWDWGSRATIVGGVDVELIPSRGGQVWDGGDDPQFVHIVLGARYPRR